jgi:N-methylhydantoinase B/oxoprolinase/acetone carboxylase alpha subunit
MALEGKCMHVVQNVITKDGINEVVNTLNGVISRAEKETKFKVSKFRVCWYNERYKEKRGRLNWC